MIPVIMTTNRPDGKCPTCGYLLQQQEKKCPVCQASEKAARPITVAVVIVIVAVIVTFVMVILN